MLGVKILEAQMPDFERITDDLSVELAETPEEKAYARGVIDGKSKARWEAAMLIAAAILIINIIRVYA